MSITPYNDGDNKRMQVERMFDNIAHSYDFLNHFLSLGIDRTWRRKAIAELAKSTQENVIDLATGTADLAILTAKMIDCEHVTGIDISNEMLSIGRRKIQQKGLADKITLQRADSENLPFEDNTYSGATVAFGVRNFQNLDRGLQEIHRVIERNGRLVVLEFSRPKWFPFKQLFNFYFKSILPLIGRFRSKDSRAYDYLYESVQAFPEGDAFLHRLRTVGFENVTTRPLTFGICSIYTGIKR